MEDFCLHLLNSEWTLWYHKSNNSDWSFESYINISTFKSIEEFGILYNNLKSTHVQNSMLFLMRDDIKPLWESPKNKNGGYISFKIFKKDIYESWNELSYLLIGENILKNKDDYRCINGISISPKKTFSIIKIWMADNNNTIESKFNKIKNFKFKEAIYKKHSS
tara:strand:+ start:8407 stop:8898 length:492 start_codon:yes stop_codon:yes gene_type:complete